MQEMFLPLNTLWTWGMLICHAILSTRWGSRQYMSHQTSRRCINVHAILKKNPLPASQDFHNSQHSVTSSQHTVLQGCSSSADGARNHFNLFYHGRQRPQSVSDCAYWRPTQYKRESRGSGRRRKSIFLGRHDWESLFSCGICLWLNREGRRKLYVFTVSTLSKLLNFYCDKGQLQ